MRRVLTVMILFLLSGLMYFTGAWIRASMRQPTSPTPASANTDYHLGERLQSVSPKAKLTPGPPAPYEEMNWFALAPKGWEPTKNFNASMDKLSDSDPRAMAALQKLREEWENAPIEPSIDGERIRIAGFAVPLESERGLVTEFLLVPYFGACIHTPPPPANQIIHVFADKPLANVRMMDAIWVNGTINVAQSRTAENTFALANNVGYQMNAQFVTPYQKP